MIRKLISPLVLLLCVTATAQKAMDNPEIVQAFDGARQAMEQALSDAEANNTNALRKTLSQANDAWKRLDDRFRDMVTTDAKWKTDFDAITDALLHASASLSRNESSESIAGHIRSALDTLNALRERHGIPVYQSDLRQVIERLEDVQAALDERGTMKAKAEKAEQRFDELMTSWQATKAKFVQTNELELPPDQLVQARRLANQQDDAFASLKEALSSRRPLLTALAARASKERLEQIGRLLTLPTKTGGFEEPKP